MTCHAKIRSNNAVFRTIIIGFNWLQVSELKKKSYFNYFFLLIFRVIMGTREIITILTISFH